MAYANTYTQTFSTSTNVEIQFSLIFTSFVWALKLSFLKCNILRDVPCLNGTILVHHLYSCNITSINVLDYHTLSVQRSSQHLCSQPLTFTLEADHYGLRPLSKCSRAGWCWTELSSVHTHRAAVLSSIDWVGGETSQRKSPLCPLLHAAPSFATDVIAPAHHSVGAHAGHLHFHSSCWSTPQPLHQQSRAIP